MKSIKTKLIIYFTILILFVSGVLALVALTTARNSVIVEVEKALVLLSEEGSKLINSRMDTHYVYIEGLSTRERISDRQASIVEKLEFLDQVVKSRQDYIRMGIVDTNGFLHFTDSFRNNATGTDVTSRQYFIDSIKGERGLLPPTVSVNPTDAGALVVAISVPIYNGNDIIGVLVGVKDANFLNALSDDMGFGDGYAYMINGEGRMIAYPDRNLVINQFNPIIEMANQPNLKALGEAFKTMLDTKIGVQKYTYEGDSIYAGYAPIEGTDWLMVITANEDEVLAAIPELQIRILLATVIILIISVLICYLIGNSITKPIISIIKHAEKIAHLDIRENVPTKFIQIKNEVGTLAIAFQTITDSLRAFIKQTADTSEQVVASSEELTATSQQSALAADDVAKTIEEIANGASEQAKETSRGAHEISSLADTINAEIELVNILNQSAERVNALKDEGFSVLKDLVEKTDQNNAAAKGVQAIIIESHESAEKIEAASEMIKNIATQTNLLALNAAIEAARAGDAGRGFAVVADEIRKLAEQSNKFASDISSVIIQLSSKTNSAVSMMEDASHIVGAQMNSLKNTHHKFEGIASAVEEVKKAVAELMASTTYMTEKKNEIVSIIDNLSSISEQNAAGAQEASASVEEQTAAMAQIADASEDLAKLAEAMQTSISRFRV